MFILFALKPSHHLEIICQMYKNTARLHLKSHYPEVFCWTPNFRTVSFDFGLTSRYFQLMPLLSQPAGPMCTLPGV
jgi:hypothetical protein